jgi:hypothetical protein
MKVFEFGLDEKDMEAISALNQNLRKIVPINKVKLDKTILHYKFSILAGSLLFPIRFLNRILPKYRFFCCHLVLINPFFESIC